MEELSREYFFQLTSQLLELHRMGLIRWVEREACFEYPAEYGWLVSWAKGEPVVRCPFCKAKKTALELDVWNKTMKQLRKDVDIKELIFNSKQYIKAIDANERVKYEIKNLQTGEIWMHEVSGILEFLKYYEQIDKEVAKFKREKSIQFGG